MSFWFFDVFGTVSRAMDSHAMDKVLYSVLAVELWHDPLVSVRILSLWLWLEHLGCNNFVRNMLSMPHALIDTFAAEAITCLRRIRNPGIMVPPEFMELQLTSIFSKRKICIQVLLQNREVVLGEINNIVDACVIILCDVIYDAMKKHRARDLLHRTIPLSSAAIEESLINSFANLGLGFHGDVGLTRNGGSDILTSTLPPEERSMFVTFSKGYPISEAELSGFFNMVFGDSFESFHMQHVRPGEQALYARVVVRLPSVIDLVLKGLPKAKFNINGKHLWMRKYVPRLPPTRGN